MARIPGSRTPTALGHSTGLVSGSADWTACLWDGGRHADGGGDGDGCLRLLGHGAAVTALHVDEVGDRCVYGLQNLC